MHSGDRLEVGHRRNEAAGLRHQGAARIGEVDLAGGALHQVDAEPILQRPDLLAERGLREKGPLSSPTEVKLLGENEKQSHLTQARLQAPSLRNMSHHSRNAINRPQKLIT
ncbi:hypothetical protein Vse01_50370 [Micromonospora sediminimaris]|uniref:Uncharacterized protein n=1 Tax=Micromonospora sediminimaris TaxID=547162 RepID=A0A9W5UW73_9ACTN|nr:hypothetical protein Vse01_50370 [Micromonospora sediminimaris]